MLARGGAHGPRQRQGHLRSRGGPEAGIARRPGSARASARQAVSPFRNSARHARPRNGGTRAAARDGQRRPARLLNGNNPISGRRLLGRSHFKLRAAPRCATTSDRRARPLRRPRPPAAAATTCPNHETSAGGDAAFETAAHAASGRRGFDAAAGRGLHACGPAPRPALTATGGPQPADSRGSGGGAALGRSRARAETSLPNPPSDLVAGESSVPGPRPAARTPRSTHPTPRRPVAAAAGRRGLRARARRAVPGSEPT